MKNRFFVLALSILVLIVSLAGLLAILYILPRVQPPVLTRPQPTEPTCVPPTDEINLRLAEGQPPQTPLFEVTGAGTTSLLRGGVLSYYDGEMWRGRGNAEHYIYEGETLSPPITSYNRQWFDDIIVESLIEVPTGTVPIFTSLHTIHVSSEFTLLHFPEEQVFHSKEEFPDAYSFRAAHYDFDDSVLLDAEIDPRDIYLQLPAAITQRTRELALTVTRDIDSPYLKARAIQNYLRTNYVYDFDYNRAPENWEANDWFLFEEKRGVCTNFNSAFVVLSRSVGIPARLVVGFLITPQEEKQVVFTDQAHAWAEVKFKGLGWYTFDATAGFDRPPTITKITSVNPVVKKGHSFNVQGIVQTKNGTPVDGVWVDILINCQKEIEDGLVIGGGITSKGYFDIEAVIPAEVAVGHYHIMAHSPGGIRYLGSWSNSIIRVVTATNLSLQVPSRVKVQEPIIVKGNLREEFGRPLVGQPIDIYLSDKKVAELITAEDGHFVWEEVLNDAGAYTVKASFVGTDYYLESSTRTDLEVFPSPYDGFAWLLLIIVLTLALAGIAGFFIYRWQKRRRLLLAPIAVQATAETQATPLLQIEKRGRKGSLNIEFPQIESPFPDVWGLDDDLEIVCHLIDPQGDRLADKPLEVYIGNELIGQLTTDKSGKGQLHYTFAEKGQYELLVRLKNEPGIKDISARRTLRIVDYREEIVDLFKMLVKWLRDLGIDLSVESTPREIEYQALNAGKGIPEVDMDNVASCFEEADYSLHAMERSNYQVMYLAQKEIREHGGKLST